MPKMKSHRGAAKRFRKTTTGKILRGRSNTSHLREGKSSSRKRRLAQTMTVSKADRSRVRRMLGA
ncbi:MAG: 50S ribosomal protein L35 [Actinomycetota bacterium]|jgi:large subunit ribosomal protein L35